MVGINVSDPRADGIPFFRRMESLDLWRHYMHGPEGVRFYTRLKTITSRWPTGFELVPNS